MKARTDIQHEVEQRIGRNLLRFQLIELRLKAALPFVHVQVSKEGLEALQDRIEAAKKMTLGSLLKAYVDAFDHVDAASRDTFRKLLGAYNKSRNWLTHHLLSETNGLASVEDCNACIARLDADYATAEDLARQVLDFHRFAIDNAQAFVDAWTTTEPGIDGTIAMGERLATRLAQIQPGAHVEIKLSTLSLLVEVMDQVQKVHVGKDGWSAFHQVGQIVRGKYVGVPKRLLAMARQLEEFEFELRRPSETSGETWMFRRGVP